MKQPAANFLKCTNVDSPLEKKFAEKFREYNINFTSQYAVYERSHNGNMKPYPKYIIDFFIKGAFCKLAIECDGLYYHLRDDQRAYDTERDLWLIKYGFDDVLRFLGDEIRDNLDGCITKIKAAIILCVRSLKDEGEIDAMAKQKFYVVWAGKKIGIFNTWDECKAQVHGVAGARYKSFKSEKEAIEAFKMSYDQFKKRQSVSHVSSDTSQQLSLIPAGNYIEESISVDAACSGNPGAMEYKGVYTKNGKEIFHFGPVQNGTNNIGEFLAIVHALALMKQKNSHLPVYSDSLIAIGWIRQKKANTSLPRNEATAHIWNLIDRAENWLNTNVYTNQILKWDTKNWGEIKADFGRKKSVK